jgi:hypothetical protein
MLNLRQKKLKNLNHSLRSLSRLQRSEDVLRERMAKKKKEILKNKPRKYKVGDTVEVDFIGVRHSAEIIDLYQTADWPHRWVYKVLLPDGYKVPYVGIKDTEKFCNIVA